VSSEVTGLATTDLRFILILWGQVTLSGLMLAFSLGALSAPRLAGLSILLAIMSNSLLARFHYYPVNFAHVLLMTAAVLLMRFTDPSRERSTSAVALVFLIASVSITHFWTSILVFVMLLSLRVKPALLNGQKSALFTHFSG